MEIQSVQSLNSRQSGELLELIKLCETEEPTRLMFTLSDSDSIYFMGYENDRLISALALYRAGQFFECAAATAPSERKKGCFSALLSEAEDLFPDVDFLFLTDGRSPSAASVLSYMGCEFEHKDCLMELDLSAYRLSYPGQFSLPACFSVEKADSEEGGISYTAFSSASPIGECHVLSDGSSACIWGVFIEEPFRGKGLGTALIFSVLNDLASSHKYKTALLHVDASNIPAVTIYKKAGFQITRTICYYLY